MLEVEGQQETVVFHCPANVAAVEDPTEGLCERIGWVDDTRDVFKRNVAVLLPLLDGEMLDRDVAGAGGRLGSIHHQDRCLVVLVEGGGTELGKSEVAENCAKVLVGLGCGHGGDKFGFSGTGGDRRLKFGAICDGTTAQGEDDTSDRSSSGKVSGMCGIDVSNQGEWISSGRKGG